MPNKRAIRYNLGPEIVRIGRLLYEYRLIVGGDGNISVRLENDLVLITPAGLCKGMLTPEDLVVIDFDSNAVHKNGDRRPSRESHLHTMIYRSRPDVEAIVHAHPPTAIAATLAEVKMDAALLPEIYLALGHVPTAPYALMGTAELVDTVTPLLNDTNAILLSHHGAVTMGESVEQAALRMEQVEQAARILLAAYQFGGASPISDERVEELRAWRAARDQTARSVNETSTV
jgi:L-fuculose-phosphate aldolase